MSDYDPPLRLTEQLSSWSAGLSGQVMLIAELDSNIRQLELLKDRWERQRYAQQRSFDICYKQAADLEYHFDKASEDPTSPFKPIPIATPVTAADSSQQQQPPRRYRIDTTPPPVLTPHADSGRRDVILLADWLSIVESGGVGDYDGRGYWATETHCSAIRAYPSEVSVGILAIPQWATHVAWTQ